MAYNASIPADTEFIANGPADIRQNQEALRTGQIVDALALKGLSPGNASGNIPVSNGNINVNLNADKLDGNDASAFSPVSHSHSAATPSSNGFMANTDKAKLDGVATGAEVNQNAFSNVVVGGTTIQADDKTDTLTLEAGANIAITPDATNDKVTIAVTGTVPNATKLATARTIAISGKATGTATSFDGSANISIPVTAVTADSCTGNAATATTLTTARTIALSGKVAGTATSFDGSANISIPVTAVTADSCTGNSATASKWASARTITLSGAVTGSVSIDGSGNVVLPTTGGTLTKATYDSGWFNATTASMYSFTLPFTGEWYVKAFWAQDSAGTTWKIDMQTNQYGDSNQTNGAHVNYISNTRAIVTTGATALVHCLWLYNRVTSAIGRYDSITSCQLRIILEQI